MSLSIQYFIKIDILYPCSIKTREVLGNPPPMPKRFFEAREMSQGQSQRDISRAEGVDLPIIPEFWWSTAIPILFIINPSLGSASGNPSL